MELDEATRQRSIDRFVDLLQQAIRTVQLLNRDWCHLDVKPENFVLDQQKDAAGNIIAQEVLAIDFEGMCAIGTPLNAAARYVAVYSTGSDSLTLRSLQ